MKSKNIIYIALITAFILLMPLVAMQFTDEVNWDLADFVIAGVLLFGAGLLYEFLASKGGTTLYRTAAGVAVATALLLVWVNGAVGIIGNESNPANLMYGGVILVGIIGALIARLKARGMSYAMFVTALAQLLVPVIALFIWPAQASWGEAGVIGVFIFSSIFAVLFIVSALLFRQASITSLTT